MSDYNFGRGGEEKIEATGTRTSVSRSATASDRLDTICESLRDARRRRLLDYLITADGEVFELADAVTAVVEREAAGTETGDQPSREDVRSALHHDHLPRLADADVLDYDTRQGTIRFTGHGGIEDWLEYARSKELE